MKFDASDRYGNGFLIIGIVRRHLKETGRADRLTEVTKRMSSGDFEHMLDVAEEVTDGAISFIGRPRN